VVGGQLLLGSLEKEKLRELLWQQAEFSSVQIVTCCLMSNHIHVLVRVLGEVVGTDAELVARAASFYGRKSRYVQTLEQAFERQGVLSADLREGLRGRMTAGSVFASTHWSVVLAAAGHETARAGAALEVLCRSYWHPLYHYFRPDEPCCRVRGADRPSSAGWAPVPGHRDTVRPGNALDQFSGGDLACLPRFRAVPGL
jgi:hypothetical protein